MRVVRGTFFRPNRSLRNPHITLPTSIPINTLEARSAVEKREDGIQWGHFSAKLECGVNTKESETVVFIYRPPFDSVPILS